MGAFTQNLFSATLVFFSLLVSEKGASLQFNDFHTRIRSDEVENSELETIRNRIIDDLLAQEVDERVVDALVKSLRPDGSWPDIDYTDVSRTGFDHSRHLRNMFVLSVAFRKPGSPRFQNAAVKQAALTALDFWLGRDFRCDNWWWNEMGTPRAMINTLLVLDEDLSDMQIIKGLRIAGRANLEAWGARPGGDRIQIAGMLGKQALFRRDETTLHRVISVMAEEIKITTGRGLQPDMSFHHRVDNVISTLSYGLGYANAFGYWAAKVAGTQYQFPAAAIRLLTDYFLDGICKSMVQGRYPDVGAKNRELSRAGTLRAADPALAENLMKTGTYRHAELEEIAAIRRGEVTSKLSWDRFYWHSEYFTHQRPGYFVSVRMHSSRNHTMEQPHNEEGLKMHHGGDGASYISRTGQEYFDIFPVWDWQKIPGTTIVQRPVHPDRKEIAKKGLTDFVGGVSDGTYGAAAFDFRSPLDPLKARKSWFFFDDEYVCLGAAITAEAAYPVLTTLNQCLLKGDVTVKSGKGETALPPGKHEISHTSWILHDSVGYVFPRAQSVHVHNGIATGHWNDINHQTSSHTATVALNVFSAWLDHGVNPRDAAYAYIVVPSAGRASVEAYARKPPVRILENTSAVQAVTHSTLNESQAVFYQPGEIKLPGNLKLVARQPCMVIVKTNGKAIQKITVSDPTHKLDSLQLAVSIPLDGSGPAWNSHWERKEKMSIISIALPREGYAGQSVVLTMPHSPHSNAADQHR